MGLGMGGWGCGRAEGTGRPEAWHSRGRETRRPLQAPGKGAGELTVQKGGGGPLSGARSALRRGQREGVGPLCSVLSSVFQH